MLELSNCFVVFSFLLTFLDKALALKERDYCVVGAGPAGLQIGYFFEKAKRDYIIYERANISGSFFTKYPRHRKLISINKRNTGSANPEYNLRHDWNSLLSDDDAMLFRHFSTEFFPKADDMVRYLGDFAKYFNLNIQYNTEVGQIEPVCDGRTDGHRYKMQDQRGVTIKCRSVIIATGLWKPNIPDVTGINLTEGYENLSTDSKDYEAKSILILGRGNSAFETADAIYDRTNFVHMLGRSRIRLAWETHYVGDLRAVNNGLLDTYQLKSLDGLLEYNDIESYKIVSEGGKLYLRSKADDIDNDVTYDNDPLLTPYDTIIRCLGFSFDHSIFKNESVSVSPVRRLYKYPYINYGYELTNMPGIYVTGTATHSLDYRKSAGGFLHGFRYTARALFKVLSFKYHSEVWPHTTLPITDLPSLILKRVNEASGIYQMFTVLADVIVINKRSSTFTYAEEFPLKLLYKLDNVTGLSSENNAILVVVLQYGQNFHGPQEDVFRVDRAATEPRYAHLSNFLHPVLYYYESLPKRMTNISSFRNAELSPIRAVDHFTSKPWDILPKPNRSHHMVEDFNARWDRPHTHVRPLTRFLENCLETKLGNTGLKECVLKSSTTVNSPLTCDRFLYGQTVI